MRQLVWFMLLAIVLLSIGSSGGPVAADQVDPEIIPADVQWVAHIDLDAARGATWADLLYRLVIAKSAKRQQFDEIRRAIGTDLIEDVDDVMFYGRWKNPDEGVLLIRGRWQHERILSVITEAAGYRTERHGVHKLHRWFEEDTGDPITGAFFGDDLVVLSKSAGNVQTALDCLDGVAPTLDIKRLDTIDLEREGTVAVLVFRELGDENFAVPTPAADLVRWLCLCVGEHDETAFADLLLVATSSDAAQQFADVARGLLAAPRLHFHDSAEVLGVLRDIELAQEDHTVRGRWKVNTDDLVRSLAREILKAEAAAAR